MQQFGSGNTRENVGFVLREVPIGLFLIALRTKRPYVHGRGRDAIAKLNREGQQPNANGT